jgi:L-ascorbate metabolism protein UlaG (beta-lactamase superfamily)
MKVRWLGWAGVEVESEDRTLVIDLLGEPGAAFAPLMDAAGTGDVPEVVAPEPGRALAGLVTHLHRDHADGPALGGALDPAAPVLEPPAAGGEMAENRALAQAAAELEAIGRERRVVEPWEGLDIGPFRIFALPAVDGLGDPQVSWLVEAEGLRILHLGDTIFHGYWWRIVQRHGPIDLVLAPINGAVVDFPHRQPTSPLPVTLDPAQAVIAGELLQARTVVPIHYDGFEIVPWYRSNAGAGKRFLESARHSGFTAQPLRLSEALEVAGHSG